jgi:7tm Chemosensory receptor
MASAGLYDALSPINSLGTLLGIKKFRAKWMAAIYCSAIVAFYLLAASFTLFPEYQDEEGENVLENETIIVYCVAYMHVSIYFLFFIVVRAQCKGENEDKIFDRFGEVSKALCYFSALENYLRRKSLMATGLIIVWACSVCVLENLLWLDAMQYEWIILLVNVFVAVSTMVLQTQLVLIANGTEFIFKYQNTALLKIQADEHLAAEIDKHRLIFGQLCDLMRDTNEHFGPVMVTSLPISIITILFCAYLFCIGFWDLEPLYSNRGTLMVIVESVWLIGLLFHQWIVFYSCEKTVKEVRTNSLKFEMLKDFYDVRVNW